jgi:hypothetical protein
MKFCVKLENKVTEVYKMFKSAVGGEKLIPTRLGHVVDLKCVILVENSEVLAGIRQH